MAEEKTFYECESPVETKDHGMLDFKGKKEEEERKPAHEEKEEEEEEEGIVSERVSDPEPKPEDNVSEFDQKVNVSDPEPKAEEKAFYECESPVETKDHGMLDFPGKKEEEKPAQEEEKVVDDQVNVPEFEKEHVSDPDPKVEEREEEEDQEEKKHDRSPSTHEEEEEKNEKTGEDQKVDDDKTSENVLPESGHPPLVKDCGDLAEEPLQGGGQEVEGPKKGFLEKMKDKQPEQQKKAAEEDLPAPAPAPMVADCLDSVKESQEVGQEGEAPKKGFLGKIKEKLHGQPKKAATEGLPAPAPPPLVADCVDSVKESQGVGQEGEAPKEGFLEKIKGKLGCHPKTSEEENKNYEVASN